MLATLLLLVVFLSLIVWGVVSLFRSLFGDSPYTVPAAPVVEMHSEEDRQGSPGVTRGKS